MILSKTPLRISFVGGGTDIPSFYKYNNYGLVLSSSINSYLYALVYILKISEYLPHKYTVCTINQVHLSSYKYFQFSLT